MQSTCEHNDQRPDFKHEIWVCSVCGKETIPFYTKVERERIALENADCNARPGPAIK